MATLQDIRTRVSLRLGDTGNVTWSTSQINDYINQGLDELSEFYPREIVQTIGTVASGTTSYAASSFSNAYRLDVYTSAGSYQSTMPHGIGDGPDSGWEMHGGVIYLPPNWMPDDGCTLRLWGYGRYTQLTGDSDSTDADTAGINAVVVYCEVEAYQALLANRAAFQQWQASPGNTDTTFLGLNQTAFSVRNRWAEEQRRLRRMRKLG